MVTAPQCEDSGRRASLVQATRTTTYSCGDSRFHVARRFNNNAAAFIAQVRDGVGGLPNADDKVAVICTLRPCPKLNAAYAPPPPPFSAARSRLCTQKYLADAPLSQLTDDQKNPMFLKANSIMLTTYLVSGFLTPFLGGVIDNVGLRAIFCAVAAIVITGLHALLALTTLYPVGPLVLLGVCYSIYAAALWPSIALVIDPANQVRGWHVQNVRACNNDAQFLPTHAAPSRRRPRTASSPPSKISASPCRLSSSRSSNRVRRARRSRTACPRGTAWSCSSWAAAPQVLSSACC